MRLACAGLVIAAASFSACSSKTANPISSADCSSFSEVGESAACDTLCAVSNAEFCSDEAVALDCEADVGQGDVIEVCGVAMDPPPLTDDVIDELERSSDVEEYSASGAPDLACMRPAGYPDAADPSSSQDVTVRGIAKIFANGCQSKNLTISIHRVIRDGSSDHGKHESEPVAPAITTAEDCSIDGVEEEVEQCELRYECVFEYTGVPTETELMIKTDGDLWAPLYEYNFFIPNDSVADGEVTKDVRALDQTDYATIAQAALGKTITPGNGAVAGEVHDCGDVRLINAVVDIDKPKFALTYFTDDEDDPLPNLSARATTSLGLYSALDVTEGPVTVAAAGVQDGALLGLGHFRAWIYPDAVTSVTFRGIRGFQIP